MTNEITKHAEEMTREKLIEVCGKIWPDAKLGRTSKADLLWLLEVASFLDAGNRGNMAQTLAKYKAGYETTVAYSGAKSQNNGDDLASLLAGLDPKSVCRLAEAVLGLEAGELWAKYEHLNPGQQRMNSGNRIRAAVKRGDLTFDDVQSAQKTFH